MQDPECGWLPRLVAIIAVSYALSPLDLIPDFIPVLGGLDGRQCTTLWVFGRALKVAVQWAVPAVACGLHPKATCCRC